MAARGALRRGWRPRRGLRASSTRNRRARPCIDSSRRGASVGQLARGSAVQPVPRTDETAAGLVTGPDDCGEEGAIGERPAAAPSPDTKDVHDGQPIDDMYGVTAQAFRTIAEGFGKPAPAFR